DPGFDPGRLLAARLSLPKSRYADRASVTRFHDALARNLEAIPGVERAGAVSALPLSGTVAAIPFAIAGRATPPGEAMVAAYGVADPGYFETMRIPLVAGRGFDPHDTAESAPVVLISQSLARSHWRDGDAVGAHLLLDDNDVGPRRVEVVGVVGDVRQESLDGEPARHIYLTLPQMPEDGVGWLVGNQYWMVRATGDPAALQAQVRGAIQAVDPDAPTSDLRTMDQYLAASVAPRRFNLWLLTLFAGMALALAASGLYGVIAYGVAQRQREIGIRMALGAGRRDVLALVVGQGLRLALAGVAAGVATAALLTRFIASLLYEVPATDALTFLSIAALLIGVALLACYLPARRATRVDPLVALHTE
ncbi:MAG TPA: FtsX-like permease family protein, partial [Candidatus Polarisedimenticolia bacterium]|nr:FtsX-like permease family protein [Candidatus Polarisedimenticolia bacterium]